CRVSVLAQPPPRSRLFPYTTLFRSSPRAPRRTRPNRSTSRGCCHDRCEDNLMEFAFYFSAGVAVAATLMVIINTRAVHAPLYLRSEEHTSELQSRENLVCRLLLEKK